MEKRRRIRIRVKLHDGTYGRPLPLMNGNGKGRRESECPYYRVCLDRINGWEKKEKAKDEMLKIRHVPVTGMTCEKCDRRGRLSAGCQEGHDPFTRLHPNIVSEDFPVAQGRVRTARYS